MNHGRPLRFLAVTLGGWTALRVALLWPTIDSVPTLIRAIAPPVAAATLPLAATPATSAAPTRPTGVAGSRRPSPLAFPHQPLAAAASSRPAPTPAPGTVTSDLPPTNKPPPLRPAPLARAPDRLAGSIWGIARGGVDDALTGGQLGGSQMGARLTYALGSARRVALAVRAAAPLHGRGAELGVGLDWQPTALPLHLIAEQRIALDGGRGGPTLMVVGGIDPRPLVAGFRLEAYGQAGAIARRSVEGFADGAVRLMRPVATRGRLRLDLGAGGWGGAQRGAARLDVGPSIAVALPIERRAVRIALDWRQRIAGNARPGSGPALSIGGDF